MVSHFAVVIVALHLLFNRSLGTCEIVFVGPMWKRVCQIEVDMNFWRTISAASPRRLTESVTRLLVPDLTVEEWTANPLVLYTARLIDRVMG